MTTQKGFAHAFLIIGLVVAIIGALGFIFWQNFIYKEPIATKTEVVKVEKKDAQPAIPVSDPVVRLQKLYADYLKDTSSYKGDSGLATFKASGYIAENYSSQVGGEPLLCGQEAYPPSVKVELSSKDSTSAKLMVTKVYEDGSRGSNGINAEMTLNKKSEWQLQKTSCIDN